MEYIPAKTIVTKAKASHWFGIAYNMNIFRGCCHGCIYCDSRSECYQNDEFDIVKVKKDALNILNLELMKKKHKGVVGIGAMSDTYNRFEKQEEITRGALKLIRDYHFGVSLETKSDLVIRDIDLFLEIQKYNDVIVKMTITTCDDELSKIIEPHVCVSSKRFLAIEKMSEAGLFTGILMHPLLPFINDTEENIIQMVKLAHDHKAHFIHAFFGVTLRDRQRDYYYQKLDEHFPGLKEKYMKRYGVRYVCQSKNVNHLRYVFQRECEKYGLLYRMEDIIKAYKTHQQTVEQLTLF